MQEVLKCNELKFSILSLINLFKRSTSFIGFIAIVMTIIISCGGSSDNDVSVVETPSNLIVEATIVGQDDTHPYGDGSGKVIFNFSANNTNLYKINFGNGDILESTGNTLTYTYLGTGTSTFTAYISAYNGDKFISTNISVTVKINSSLLWSDEFNYTGSPDSNKWNYNIGRGDNGWGNGEEQYYTSRTENVKVENGHLIITAKKENYEGANYTSTRLLTQGKFDFTYGTVEIKAKLPTGGGTWPALWLLGSNINTVGWPACGEIDIMEHVGNNQGTVQSAMHTPSSYGGTVNHGSQFLDDVSTEFHIYAVEWTSEKMVFSVDGIEHYTYNPSAKDNSTWPYDLDQFIILNIAMGGGFGGAIDPNFVSSTMEIDYVRVYQ